MSLTTAQKAKIIYVLGWPAKTLTVDSTHYNSTVADRLNGIDSDSETIVQTILTNIDAVQTKYTASTSRALVKKVGDIELNTDEHTSLSSEYKRLLRDLAQLVDIPLRKSRSNVGVIC